MYNKLRALIGACGALFTLCTAMPAIAGNELPVINQVKLVVDKNNKKVTVSYLLSDKEDEKIKVEFRISADGGATYTPVKNNITGDIGEGIAPGKKSFEWSYSSYNFQGAGVLYKLVADDGYQVDIAELVNKVDTNRLRRNTERIAIIRDPETDSGRYNLNRVRNTISNLFEQDNYELEKQPFRFGAVQGLNIIGKKQGTGKEENIYVVCASYDGIQGCPAANNNASGVAAMMEIAEIISGYNFTSTIVVLATDYTGEEFIGSNWYVFRGGIKDHEQLQGAIDLDRIGTYSERPNTHLIGESKPVLFPENCKAIEADSLRANFLKVISNTWSAPLADEFVKNSKKYAPGLTTYVEEFPGYGEFSVGTEDFLQFSDHISFWYHRYKAIWITDAKEGIRRDNTPDDTIDKLNFNFLGNTVRIALGTLAGLAGAGHSTIVKGSFDL
jgi:hypothetical protein